MTKKSKIFSRFDPLRLETAIRKDPAENPQYNMLSTSGGTIEVAYHHVKKASQAVLWVGGAGGGLEGPAAGLYPRVANRLLQFGIASLRLDYRHPNYLDHCIRDVLLGIDYLKEEGITEVILAGHSFGGAVVIGAGILRPHVAGVIAMSSQLHGTRDVYKLSPKSLLLLHGTSDEILPAYCSENIYARALEPKEIILYPGCRHGLDHCISQVDADLQKWILNLWGI